MDHEFKEATKQDNDFKAMIIAFTCLKEYIKSELSGFRPVYMKGAMFEIARLMIECFEDAYGTESDWEETNKLLNHIAVNLRFRVDLPNTYRHNAVYAVDEFRNVDLATNIGRRHLGISKGIPMYTAKKIDDRFKHFLMGKEDPLARS